MRCRPAIPERAGPTTAQRGLSIFLMLMPNPIIIKIRPLVESLTERYQTHEKMQRVRGVGRQKDQKRMDDCWFASVAAVR